ncbi:hypothetical protein [Mumia sp. ZJ430]|uniref:hypothetical protein n=1 Tax=Mumia sp. ZJ430 TaxID=2708083 RepID=UPI00141F6F90|nr:hypothetical protein [Mumia sp. ZJ430]
MGDRTGSVSAGDGLGVLIAAIAAVPPTMAISTPRSARAILVDNVMAFTVLAQHRKNMKRG